jgi:hypothetical protein
MEGGSLWLTGQGDLADFPWIPMRLDLVAAGELQSRNGSFMTEWFVSAAELHSQVV